MTVVGLCVISAEFDEPNRGSGWEESLQVAPAGLGISSSAVCSSSSSFAHHRSMVVRVRVRVQLLQTKLNRAKPTYWY